MSRLHDTGPPGPYKQYKSRLRFDEESNIEWVRRLKQAGVLAAYLKDNVNARELQSEGAYLRVRPAEGEKRFDCQLEFETVEFSPLRRDRASEKSINVKYFIARELPREARTNL